MICNTYNDLDVKLYLSYIHNSTFNTLSVNNSSTFLSAVNSLINFYYNDFINSVDNGAYKDVLSLKQVSLQNLQEIYSEADSRTDMETIKQGILAAIQNTAKSIYFIEQWNTNGIRIAYGNDPLYKSLRRNNYKESPEMTDLLADASIQLATTGQLGLWYNLLGEVATRLYGENASMETDEAINNIPYTDDNLSPDYENSDIEDYTPKNTLLVNLTKKIQEIVDNSIKSKTVPTLKNLKDAFGKSLALVEDLTLATNLFFSQLTMSPKSINMENYFSSFTSDSGKGEKLHTTFLLDNGGQSKVKKVIYSDGVFFVQEGRLSDTQFELAAGIENEILSVEQFFNKYENREFKQDTRIESFQEFQTRIRNMVEQFKKARIAYLKEQQRVTTFIGGGAFNRMNPLVTNEGRKAVAASNQFIKTLHSLLFKGEKQKDGTVKPLTLDITNLPGYDYKIIYKAEKYFRGSESYRRVIIEGSLNGKTFVIGNIDPRENYLPDDFTTGLNNVVFPENQSIVDITDQDWIPKKITYNTEKDTIVVKTLMGDSVDVHPLYQDVQRYETSNLDQSSNRKIFLFARFNEGSINSVTGVSNEPRLTELEITELLANWKDISERFNISNSEAGITLKDGVYSVTNEDQLYKFISKPLNIPFKSWRDSMTEMGFAVTSPYISTITELSEVSKIKNTRGSRGEAMVFYSPFLTLNELTTLIQNNGEAKILYELGDNKSDTIELQRKKEKMFEGFQERPDFRFLSRKFGISTLILKTKPVSFDVLKYVIDQLKVSRGKLAESEININGVATIFYGGRQISNTVQSMYWHLKLTELLTEIGLPTDETIRYKILDTLFNPTDRYFVEENGKFNLQSEDNSAIRNPTTSYLDRRSMIERKADTVAALITGNTLGAPNRVDSVLKEGNRDQLVNYLIKHFADNNKIVEAVEIEKIIDSNIKNKTAKTRPTLDFRYENFIILLDNKQQVIGRQFTNEYKDYLTDQYNSYNLLTAKDKFEKSNLIASKLYGYPIIHKVSTTTSGNIKVEQKENIKGYKTQLPDMDPIGQIRVEVRTDKGIRREYVQNVPQGAITLNRGGRGGMQSIDFQDYLEWEFENRQDTFSKEWNNGNQTRDNAGEYEVEGNRFKTGILYNLVAEPVSEAVKVTLNKAAVRPILESTGDFVQSTLLEVDHNPTLPHMMLDMTDRGNNLWEGLEESQEAQIEKLQQREVVDELDLSEFLMDSNDTSELDNEIFFKLQDSTIKEKDYTLTVDEAFDRLSRMFGDWITKDKLKTFTNTQYVNGKQVLGYYINSLIALHEKEGKVSERVLMHEAFHKVVDLFLTKDQKSKLFNDTLKLYKADTNSTESPDTEQLEEYLSDLYMNTFGQYKSKYWSAIKRSGILDLANTVLGKGNFVFKFFKGLRNMYLSITNNSNIRSMLELLDNDIIRYSSQEVVSTLMDTPKYKLGMREEAEMVELTKDLMFAFASPTIDSKNEEARLKSGEERLQEVTRRMRNKYITKSYFTLESLITLEGSPIKILTSIQNDFNTYLTEKLDANPKLLEKFKTPSLVIYLRNLRKSDPATYTTLLTKLQEINLFPDKDTIDLLLVLTDETKKNGKIVSSNFVKFIQYEFSDLVDIDLEVDVDLDSKDDKDQDLGFTIITKDRPDVDHSDTLSTRVKRLLYSLTYTDKDGKVRNVKPDVIEPTLFQLFDEVKQKKGVLGDDNQNIENLYDVLSKKLAAFKDNTNSEAYHHNKVLMDYFFDLKRESLSTFSLRNISSSATSDIEVIKEAAKKLFNRFKLNVLSVEEIVSTYNSLLKTNLDPKSFKGSENINKDVLDVLSKLTPALIKQNTERNREALNALVAGFKSGEYKKFATPKVNDKQGAKPSKIVGRTEANVLGGLSNAIQSMIDVKSKGADRFKLTDSAKNLLGLGTEENGIVAAGKMRIMFSKSAEGLKLNFTNSVDTTKNREFIIDKSEQTQNNVNESSGDRYSIPIVKLEEIYAGFSGVIDESGRTAFDPRYLSAMLNAVGLDMSIEVVLQYVNNTKDGGLKLLEQLLLGYTSLHAQYLATITQESQDPAQPVKRSYGEIVNGVLQLNENSLTNGTDRLIYKLTKNRNDVTYESYIGETRMGDMQTSQNILLTGWSPVRDYSNVFTRIIEEYNQFKQGTVKTTIKIDGNNYALTGLTTTASGLLSQLERLNSFVLEENEESKSLTEEEEQLIDKVNTSTPDEVKQLIEDQYKNKPYLVSPTYTNGLFRLKLQGNKLVNSISNGVTKLLKVNKVGIFNHIENDRTGKTKSFSKISPTEMFNQLFNGEFFIGDTPFGSYTSLVGRRMKMFIKNIADRDANFLLEHNNKIFYDFEKRDSETLFGLGDQAEAEYMNIYAGQLLYVKNIAKEILAFYDKDKASKYASESLQVSDQVESLNKLLSKIEEQEQAYKVYVTDFNRLDLAKGRLTQLQTKLVNGVLSEEESVRITTQVEKEIRDREDSITLVKQQLETSTIELNNLILNEQNRLNSEIELDTLVTTNLFPLLKGVAESKRNEFESAMLLASTTIQENKLKEQELKKILKEVETLNKQTEKRTGKLQSIANDLEVLNGRILAGGTDKQRDNWNNKIDDLIEQRNTLLLEEGVTTIDVDAIETQLEAVRESILDNRNILKVTKQRLDNEVDKLETILALDRTTVFTRLKQLNIGGLNLTDTQSNQLEDYRKIGGELIQKVKEENQLQEKLEKDKIKYQKRLDGLLIKNLPVLTNVKLNRIEQLNTQISTIQTEIQELESKLTSDGQERALPKQSKLKKLNALGSDTRVLLDQLDRLLVTSAGLDHTLLKELTTGKHINKKRKVITKKVGDQKVPTMINPILDQSLVSSVEEFMNIQIATLARGVMFTLQNSPDKLSISVGGQNNDRYNSLNGDKVTVGDTQIDYTEQRSNFIQYKYFIEQEGKFIEISKSSQPKVYESLDAIQEVEPDLQRIENSKNLPLWGVPVPHNSKKRISDFAAGINTKRIELLPYIREEVEYTFKTGKASQFLKNFLNEVHPGIVDFLLSYNINTYYVDEFLSGSPFQYPGDTHGASIDAVKRFGTAGTPSTKGNWYDPIYNPNAPKTTQTSLNVDGLNISLAEDTQQYFADAFTPVYQFDRDFKDFVKSSNLIDSNTINWKEQQTIDTLDKLRGMHGKIYKYQEFNVKDKVQPDLNIVFQVVEGQLLLNGNVKLTRQKGSGDALTDADYKPLDGISNYSFLFWMQLLSAYGANEGRDTSATALKMIIDDRNLDTQEVLAMKSLQMVLSSKVAYKASDKIKSLLRASLEMGVLNEPYPNRTWSYFLKDKYSDQSGNRNKTLFDVYMENGGWFPTDTGVFDQVNFSPTGLNIDTGIKVSPSELAVYKAWQEASKGKNFLYLDRLNITETGDLKYLTEEQFLQEIGINPTQSPSKLARAIDKYLKDNPSRFSRMEGAAIVNYSDSLKKGGSSFNKIPEKNTNIKTLLSSNININELGDIVQLQKKEKADSEMTTPTQLLYNLGAMGNNYHIAKKVYQFMGKLSDNARTRIERKVAGYKVELKDDTKYEVSRQQIKDNLTENLKNPYFFAALTPIVTDFIISNTTYSVKSYEDIEAVQQSVTASGSTINVEQLLSDKLFNAELDRLAMKRYFRDVIHTGKVMNGENDVVRLLTSPDFTDLQELSISNPALLYSVMGEVASQFSKGIILKAHGKKSLQLPADEFIELYETTTGVINDGVKRVYTKEDIIKTIITTSDGFTYNDAVNRLDKLIRKGDVLKRASKYAYPTIVNGDKQIYHTEIVGENPMFPYYKEIMKDKGINEIFHVQGSGTNIHFLADSWNEIEETVNLNLKKLFNDRGKFLITDSKEVGKFNNSVLVRAIKADKQKAIDVINAQLENFSKMTVDSLKDKYTKELEKERKRIEHKLERLSEKESTEKIEKEKQDLNATLDNIDDILSKIPSYKRSTVLTVMTNKLEERRKQIEQNLNYTTREDVRRYMINFNRSLYGNMSRIPNTGKNSNSFFKIVGFSSDYGNAVFTPGPWLFISGSDYDGDTLQLWQYHPTGEDKDSDTALDFVRQIMTDYNNSSEIFSELDESMEVIGERSRIKFNNMFSKLRSGDYWSWVQIHQQNAIGKLGVGAMALLGKHYVYTSQAMKKLADFITVEKALLNKTLTIDERLSLVYLTQSDLLGFIKNNTNKKVYDEKVASQGVVGIANTIAKFIKTNVGNVSIDDIVNNLEIKVGEETKYVRNQALESLRAKAIELDKLDIIENIGKLEDYLSEHDMEIATATGEVLTATSSYLEIEKLLKEILKETDAYDSTIDLEQLNSQFSQFLQLNGKKFFKSDLSSKAADEEQVKKLLNKLEESNKANVDSLIAIANEEALNNLDTKSFTVNIAADLDIDKQPIRQWVESLIQSAVDNAKHMTLGASNITLENSDLQAAMTFLGIPKNFIMDIFTKPAVVDLFTRFKDANDIKNEYGKDILSFIGSELTSLGGREEELSGIASKVFSSDYLKNKGIRSVDENGVVTINPDKVDNKFLFEVLYALATYAQDYSKVAGAMQPTYGVRGRQEDGDAQLDKILEGYDVTTLAQLDKLVSEIEQLERNNISLFTHPKIFKSLTEGDKKLVQANMVGLSFPHVRKMLKSHLMFHKAKYDTHALYSPIMQRLRSSIKKFTDRVSMNKAYNKGALLTTVYQTVYSKFLKNTDYQTYSTYKIVDGELVKGEPIRLDSPEKLLTFKQYMEDLVINLTKLDDTTDLEFMNNLTSLNGEIYLPGGEAIKHDSPEVKQLMAQFSRLPNELQSQLFQYLLVNKRYGLAHRKGSYYQFISDKFHKDFDKFLSKELEQNSHLYFSHTLDGETDPDTLIELITMWYAVDNPSTIKDSTKVNRSDSGTTYSTYYTEGGYRNREEFPEILEVKKKIGKDEKPINPNSLSYYKLSDYSKKQQRKTSIQSSKELKSTMSKVDSEVNLLFTSYKPNLEVFGTLTNIDIETSVQDNGGLTTLTNIENELTKQMSLLEEQSKQGVKEFTINGLEDNLGLVLNAWRRNYYNSLLNSSLYSFGDITIEELQEILIKEAVNKNIETITFNDIDFISLIKNEIDKFYESKQETLKEYRDSLEVLNSYKEIKGEILTKAIEGSDVEITEEQLEDKDTILIPAFIRIPVYKQDQPTLHKIYKLEKGVSGYVYRAIFNPAYGLGINLAGDIDYMINGVRVNQKDLFFINPDNQLQEGQYRMSNTGKIETVKSVEDSKEMHKLKRSENMNFVQRSKSQVRLKLLARILKKVLGVKIEYVESKQMVNPNSVGYVKNGVVYMNIEKATYKDLLHEMGHILLPLVSKNLDLSVYETSEIIEKINNKIQEYLELGRDLSYSEAREEVLSDELMNRFHLPLTKLLFENIKLELSKVFGVPVTISTIDDLLLNTVKVLEGDNISNKEKQEIVSLLATDKTKTDVKSNIQFECL